MAVQGAIDATLQAKYCYAVSSNSPLGLVAWRIDCLTLVAQANLLTVAQAEFPLVIVYTDPMWSQKNQSRWAPLEPAQHFPHSVSVLAILATLPKLRLWEPCHAAS